MHVELTHLAVQQKLTQHCKASIQDQPLTEVVFPLSVKYQKELTLKRETDSNHLTSSPLECELPDSRAHDLVIILMSTIVFDTHRFQIHMC